MFESGDPKTSTFFLSQQQKMTINWKDKKKSDERYGEIRV